MSNKSTKTQMPYDFQESMTNWEEVTRTAADQLIEATQKSFEAALAMQERMTGMWMENLKKLQELSLKETETAFEMAEALQDQMKAAAERTSTLMSK